MNLSIRDTNRFILGAAIMREKAIEASGNTSITIDNIAVAALRNNADGEKLRSSIAILADRESEYFRNTPTHALNTERVIQSRAAEQHTFATINAAVVATLEFDNDSASADKLQSQYKQAFKAIDKTPGSTQDRRMLKSMLEEQVFAVSKDTDFISESLNKSEKAYLDDLEKETLARYINPTLHRSDDYNNLMP